MFALRKYPSRARSSPPQPQRDDTPIELLALIAVALLIAAIFIAPAIFAR